MPGYTSHKDVLTLLDKQGHVCAGVGCTTVLVYENKKRMNFIIEHKWATKRGGDNSLDNKDARCRPCANKKTYGTGARSAGTTSGTDVGELAKEKAIIREKKFAVNKRPPGEARPRSRWPSRPLKSRNSFQQRRTP